MALLKVKRDEIITYNFKWGEIVPEDVRFIDTNTHINLIMIVAFAQSIRDHYNRKVLVHSGYRDGDDGYHGKGLALDITVDGVDTEQVAVDFGGWPKDKDLKAYIDKGTWPSTLKTGHIGGFGLYTNHIHIDHGYYLNGKLALRRRWTGYSQ